MGKDAAILLGTTTHCCSRAIAGQAEVFLKVASSNNNLRVTSSGGGWMVAWWFWSISSPFPFVQRWVRQ